MRYFKNSKEILILNQECLTSIIAFKIYLLRIGDLYDHASQAFLVYV